MIGFNDGVAKLDELEMDAKKVQEYYLSKGYLDVKVGTPLLRVDNSSYTAEIIYDIEEGDKYRVKGVDIVGLFDSLNRDEIMDNLQIKSGKIFDINKMKRDVEYIREKVANLGYAYAKVSPRFNKNGMDKVVDINYIVSAGREVYITDVTPIWGTTQQRIGVIRRRIYIKAPGDRFKLRRILQDSGNCLKEERKGFTFWEEGGRII